MKTILVGSFLVILSTTLSSASFAQDTKCSKTTVDYAGNTVLMSTLAYNDNFTCKYKGSSVPTQVKFLGWDKCVVNTYLDLGSEAPLKVISATVQSSGHASFNLENTASPVECQYDAAEVRSGTVNKAMKVARAIEQSNDSPSPLSVYTAKSKIYTTDLGQGNSIKYFVEYVNIEAKTSESGVNAYRQYKMEWQNGTMVKFEITYSGYPQVL